MVKLNKTEDQYQQSTATTGSTTIIKTEEQSTISPKIHWIIACSFLLLATIFGYRRLLISCLLLPIYSIGLIILLVGFNLGLSYWIHSQDLLQHSLPRETVDRKKRTLYDRLNFSTPAAYSAALTKKSWETHTEWRHEPLHPSLQPKTSAVLDRLIAKIMRDFVWKASRSLSMIPTWYDELCPPSNADSGPSPNHQHEKLESSTPIDTFSSPAFPLAVEKTIRRSLRTLLDRFGKIDLTNLIIHKILPILTTHVEAFRQAEYDLRGGGLSVHDHSRRSRNESRGRLYRAFYSSGNDEIDLLLSRLHADVLRRKSQEAESNSPSSPNEERFKPSSRLHPAVDVPTPNSQSSEQAHLRKLLDLLLPLILPPTESKSLGVKTLVIELLTCSVITPVIEMLSDSDFWNNLIEERAGNVIREQRMVEQLRQVLDRQLSFVTTSSCKMETGGSSSSPPIKPTTGPASQANQLSMPPTMTRSKQNGAADYEFNTSTESISIRSTAKEFERFSRSIQRCNTLFDVRRLKNDVETQIRKAEAELVGGFEPEQLDKTQQNYLESNLPSSNSQGELTKFLERLSAARDILDHRLAELGGLSGPVTNSWPSDSAGCAEPNASSSLRMLEALHKLQPSRSSSQILQEILRDRESPALSYFTEFMDRRQRVKLIQFWLAVEGLKNPLEEDLVFNADSKSVRLPGRSVPAKSYASSTHEVPVGTCHLPERDLDAMRADIQAIAEINFSTVEATDLLGLEQTEVLPLLSFLSSELTESYQSTFSTTRAELVLSNSSLTKNKIYFVTEARAALFSMQRKVFDLMLVEDFPAFAAAGDLYLRATASLCRAKSANGSAPSPAGLVTSESFPNLIDLKSSNHHLKTRLGTSLSHKFIPVTKPQHLSNSSDPSFRPPNMLAGLMGSDFNKSMGKKDTMMARSRSFNGSIPSLESQPGHKYGYESPKSITSLSVMTPARRGAPGAHKATPSTSSIIHTVLRSKSTDVDKHNRRIVPSPVPPQVTLQEAFDERLPGERLTGPGTNTQYDQHILSLSNYTFPVHLPSPSSSTSEQYQSSIKFQSIHPISSTKYQMISPSLDFLISPPPAIKDDNRAPLFGDDINFAIRNVDPSNRPVSMISKVDQPMSHSNLTNQSIVDKTTNQAEKYRKREPKMTADANLALQEALSSIISTSDQSPSIGGSRELPIHHQNKQHSSNGHQVLKHRSSCSSLLGDESGSTLDWPLDTRQNRSQKLPGGLDHHKAISRSTPSSPVSKPSQRKGLFDDDDEDEEENEEENDLLLIKSNKQSVSPAKNKLRKQADLPHEIRPVQSGLSSSTTTRTMTATTVVTNVAEADERIMKLENELILLSSLMRRAELTGNKLEIRLVKKSIESVGKEISENFYRKSRLIQLKEIASGGFRAKLVPGRVKLSITGMSRAGGTAPTPSSSSSSYFFFKDDLNIPSTSQQSEKEKKTRKNHSVSGSNTVQQQQPQEYVLYKIEVHKLTEDGSFGSGWIVQRRYNEFNSLNQSLKTQYPISRQLDFPSKLFGLTSLPVAATNAGLGFVVNVNVRPNLLGNNNNNNSTNVTNNSISMTHGKNLTLIEQRRLGLERYLKALIQIPVLCESPELAKFLSRSPSSSTSSSKNNEQDRPGEFFANTTNFVRSIYKSIVTGGGGTSSTNHQNYRHDLSKNNRESIEINDLGKTKKKKKNRPINDHEEEEEEEEGYRSVDDDRLIDLTHNFKPIEGELLTPFTQPISNLLIEIFELNDHHQWLRKQGIVIILHKSWVGLSKRTLVPDEEEDSSRVGKDKQKETAIDNKEPKPKPRSIEERLMTCDGAYRKLSAIIPDYAASILGRSNARLATRRSFSMFQNRRLNKHLIYTILDEIIKTLFPELIGTSKPKNNKTVAKSAADILSRPRLAKKKPATNGKSKPKQGKKNNNNEAIESDTHPEPIDNEQLLEQLLNQTNELNISSSEPTTPSSPSLVMRPVWAARFQGNYIISKPHRTKQKIAKRQAAQLQAQLDAQIESSLHPVIDHRKLENEALHRICLSLHLQIFEIIPDGHCLYSAISDQLNLLNLNQQEKYTYKDCRQLASEYMRSNQDEFINYLVGIEEQQGDGDGDGEEGCLMTGIQYSNYCDKVRDSACWGGQPEILALSKALKFSITVVQAFHPTIKVSEEYLESRDNKSLMISYHRKSYGLGEHYNSLRPIS
ncbi:hypothetical protein KEM48_009430 [Puccinia striiformis f. sp. tritici PST-130]|nr:hypothetical protein KEM48_009430 [Puccinia striiformis f. sp. tritici PST-130]